MFISICTRCLCNTNVQDSMIMKWMIGYQRRRTSIGRELLDGRPQEPIAPFVTSKQWYIPLLCWICDFEGIGHKIPKGTSVDASNKDSPLMAKHQVKKFQRYVPSPVLEDLKLWHRSFLPKIHKGLSLNLITYRRPSITCWSDACPKGMGGFASLGHAWQFQILQEK